MRLYAPAALKCLIAIAEEGTFNRAAVRLGLTQSAVSQRINSLEAVAGTILVVRCRPIRFTPAGEAMLRHARKAQQLAAGIHVELRELLAAEEA